MLPGKLRRQREESSEITPRRLLRPGHNSRFTFAAAHMSFIVRLREYCSLLGNTLSWCHVETCDEESPFHFQVWILNMTIQPAAS